MRFGHHTRMLELQIATFISESDFSEKIIVSFCTHEGGGEGRIMKDISKMCPGATLLDGFVVYGSGTGDTQTKISTWLRKIGISSM